MQYERIEQKEFEGIRRNTLNSIEYWKDNNLSFHNSLAFLHDTTLIESDRDKIERLGLPEVEFNMIEPVTAQCVTQFFEMQPELQIENNSLFLNVEGEEILKAHMKYIFCNNAIFATNIMDDTTGGGFSVAKIIVEYENNRSFDKTFRLEKVNDPTMVFFDTLSEDISKMDGKYCGEFIPMVEDDIKKRYPGINIGEIQNAFGYDFGNRYFLKIMNDNKKMYFPCKYFEAREVEHKLLEVYDPNADTTHNFFEDELELIMDKFKRAQRADRRLTDPVIMRDRIVPVKEIWESLYLGNIWLEKPTKTIYPSLPYCFFDGRSARFGGMQKTRPLFYNARDWQRAKNLVGSAMLNQIINLRQADILIAERALPDVGQPEYLSAYTSPQDARTAFVWKDVDGKGNPVPEPKYFTPGQPNPILMAVFNELNTTLRGILGIKDTVTGDMSGEAIATGAMLTNESFKPYIIRYLMSLSDIGQFFIEAIPRLYTGGRRIPTLDSNGSTVFKEINGDSGVSFNYESKLVKLQLKPGLSSAAQKEKSLKLIFNAMSTSQEFSNFINSKCLVYIVDSLGLKDGDLMKQKAVDFMAEQEAAQAEAKANPPKDPALIAQETAIQIASIQDATKKIKIQTDAMIQMSKLEIDKQNLTETQKVDAFDSYLELMRLHVSAKEAHERSVAESERSQAMKEIKEIEFQMKQIELILGIHKNLNEMEKSVDTVNNT